MMVTRQTQQSLAAALGRERSLQACAPTCFYMVALAAGYVPSGVTLAAFCSQLDWATAFSVERGWVRPALARQLRHQYDMQIVSWQLAGSRATDAETIARMVAAGYLATPPEIDFYRRQVAGHDIAEIVRLGYPVIVGMKAGFAANDQSHAVVLLDWTEAGVTVIDPDDRNAQRQYTTEYIQEFLNPTGGGATLILPRK